MSSWKFRPTSQKILDRLTSSECNDYLFPYVVACNKALRISLSAVQLDVLSVSIGQTLWSDSRTSVTKVLFRGLGQ